MQFCRDREHYSVWTTRGKRRRTRLSDMFWVQFLKIQPILMKIGVLNNEVVLKILTEGNLSIFIFSLILDPPPGGNFQGNGPQNQGNPLICSSAPGDTRTGSAHLRWLK